MQCLTRGIATLFIAILLSGCVVTPKFAEDRLISDCEVFTRSIELDIWGVDTLSGSSSLSPEELIGVLGIFTASAVVSGSIYIVGNTVHWLEKVGRCDYEERLDNDVEALSEDLISAGGKSVELEQESNAILQQEKENTFPLNSPLLTVPQ